MENRAKAEIMADDLIRAAATATELWAAWIPLYRSGQDHQSAEEEAAWRLYEAACGAMASAREKLLAAINP